MLQLRYVNECARNRTWLPWTGSHTSNYCNCVEYAYLLLTRHLNALT